MKKFLYILIIFVLVFSLGNVFAQENVLSQKVSELAAKLAFAVEGYVVGVSDETVYINLGQASGIVEGIKFEVVRLDKDHPFKMGEKIIGYPETEVGQIEITRVRKEMSLAKITKKVMAIQEGDKVYQEIKKVTRIAITEFTYGDEFNDFTRNLQDILYTNLIQKGMTVVEREKINQVLEELGKSFSGMIDFSTAAEIGKMLGVEAIVVGTVADMGNSVDLRARLVDVEKGAAITAAQTDVVKDPSIMELLKSRVRKATYVREKTITPEEKGVSEEIPLNWSRKIRYWNLTLISYQLFEDRTIQFNFLIENLENSPCKFYIGENTYLIDNLVNKYISPITSMPTDSREAVALIQNYNVEFTVSFSKLQEGIEAVALEFYLPWQNFDCTVGGDYCWRGDTVSFGPIKLK